MALEWSRDSDLCLVRLIRLQLGADVWDSAQNKSINWDQIHRAAPWPENFTKERLKERWQENFRKWVPRQPKKRADVVHFDTLLAVINERSYGDKLARRNPELDIRSTKAVQLCAATQPISADSSKAAVMQLREAPSEWVLLWMACICID